MGTEGLLCIDLDLGEVLHHTIFHWTYWIPVTKIVCPLNQNHVRLVPVRALGGDNVEWIKVADTKSYIIFTTGILRQGHGTQTAVYCLCIAATMPNVRAAPDSRAKETSTKECNPVTGECLCDAGYRGVRCETQMS